MSPTHRVLPPVAWAPLPERSAVLARGPDAVRFCDGFATAALGGLAPGTGTEAFFADARGHVLALANVLRTEDGLWLDAAAGVADRLQPHLEHYRIREHLDIVNASADRAAFLLAGDGATEWLASRAAGRVPTGLLDHARVRAGDVDAEVVALDWFGPGGLLIAAPRAAAAGLAAWLRTAGLPQLDAAAVAAARIEAGTPDPVDLDARTLPQELGRDARAISFTKGCYLGQETVARLDALGHVNRRLVAVAAAAMPAVGATVTAGGEPVGRITSACLSPRLECGLGLALVHVRALGGAAIEIDGQPARVVPPPAAARGAD